MNKIFYYVLYIILYLHALLPFWLLYILSDILYIFVYKIVGYRLKVVRRNMAAAFPEKSAKDLRTLEIRFYHHFCDYFFETIKLLHISEKTIRKRMVFLNTDLAVDLTKDGNSSLMFLGHYGNWEWIPSLTIEFQDTPILLGQIYRPLKNKAFDNLFIKIRSRFGSFGIPKNDTLRAIIRLRREGKQTMIGFMSDQTPSVNNIHYWTTFLNQDTPVYTGVERIAKQTGFYVFYLDVKKVKRGYYTATIKLISAEPKNEPEFKITETYIREMENSILRDPAYWLWTHKRWKWKREEVQRRQAEHKKK